MVVVALLALVVMVAVPLTGRRVHQIKLRAAAQQFTTAVRAARTIAVTKRRAVDLTISPCGQSTLFYPAEQGGGLRPDNAYWYTDARGHEQLVELPPGVWIEPGSMAVLSFQPNGSLAAQASTVIGSRYSGVYRTWTVLTSVAGIPDMVSLESPAQGELPCDNPAGP